MPASPCPIRPRRQRGGSLVSTLVAVLALALGVLATTRAQSHLRTGTESARQRVEALGLAQDELERLRASPHVDAGTAGGAEPSPGGGRVVGSSGGTAAAYRIERMETADTGSAPAMVQVAVRWRDGAGTARSVRLETMLGRVDPALGGMLARPVRAGPLARVHGCDVRIPLAAHDLGDGRSVVSLGPASPHTVLVDNATGAVVAVCAAEAGRTGRAAGHVDPAACTPVAGLLVTGRVRFSLGSAPSALAADDAPLAFDVSIAAASATAAPPRCGTEAKSAGGERWVDYICVVVPAAGTAGWSGRVELVPAGWEIGTAAGRWRVCRHSADHDASGAIERAAEPPARQRQVVGSLAEQNFIVVAGTRQCPGGAPVEIDGHGTENHADLSTVQHQP